MIPAAADLGEILRQRLAIFGHHVAVEDSDRSETFDELNRRSDRLAVALLEVNPARRPVAILASNRLEFIEADLALIKAGQPKVPINPKLSHGEKTHILRDSGAAVVITEHSYRGELEDYVVEFADPPRIVAFGGNESGYEDLIAGANGPPHRLWRPDDPSVILYTSGTTGQPKGATATFRTRMAATWTMLLDELVDVAPGDGMLHVGPLSHGSGSKVLAYALSGARNIVLPAFDPSRFLDESRRHSATASFVVPTMINMLVEEAESTGQTPTTLRHISYGGSPIAPATIRQAVEVFGPIFVQVFGTAEAPHPLTVLTQEDHIDASDHRLATAGRPTKCVEVKIAHSGPGDNAGEILVRAESVMIGYWNNPEATSEVFVDGFYKTGDVGTIDAEGYLSIIDRKKDMVITGGLNVYSAEVEAALARHPGVLESAVIGIPDDHWGEMVTAYVVARPGHRLSPEEITAHVGQELAGYKKPRKVWLVEDLPKGSTGKILKEELRKAHWESAARRIH